MKNRDDNKFVLRVMHLIDDNIRQARNNPFQCAGIVAACPVNGKVSSNSMLPNSRSLPIFAFARLSRAIQSKIFSISCRAGSS
jgi:hypothetical protein